MKFRVKFVHLWSKKKQKGQAIIEFVLLLAVLTLITYGFVYFMNRNLAKYWEYSANLIINDRPGEKTVKLE
jgi:hypothetical protein